MPQSAHGLCSVPLALSSVTLAQRESMWSEPAVYGSPLREDDNNFPLREDDNNFPLREDDGSFPLCEDDKDRN